MKSTGIVRHVDELGRIVMPIELRRILNLKHKDPMEVYIDQDLIVLRKYAIDCIFCGNKENLINLKGKPVCEKCLNELKKRINEDISL